MIRNLLFLVEAVMAFVVLGLVATVGRRGKKGNGVMLGLTTDFSGEDSDQEAMTASMEVGSEIWAREETRRFEKALFQDELSAKRYTERTRQYYVDRADAELDNEIHDRIHRRSRREMLRELKEKFHAGRMVQYRSLRAGIREARIVGYSSKRGKSFTARLQLMGSNTIVRKHISELIAA